MKRLFRKLFPKKPVYEPAGIVHYGEYHLTIGGIYYEAYNQPDGTTEVWANGQHIGDYEKDITLHAIIEHAKGQKNDR